MYFQDYFTYYYAWNFNSASFRVSESLIVDWRDKLDFRFYLCVACERMLHRALRQEQRRCTAKSGEMTLRAKQAAERPVRTHRRLSLRTMTPLLVPPTMRETARMLGFALFNLDELSVSLRIVFYLWFGHKNCLHQRLVCKTQDFVLIVH